MTWALAIAAAGLTSALLVRWRARLRIAAIRRAELGVCRALTTRGTWNLAPSLARMVEQARMLRLLAEAPLMHADTPLAEGLWGRRMRCREYDVALADLRRALWEWMLALTRLDESQRRALAEMGLNGAPFRRLLYVSCDRGEDLWTEGLFARSPDPDEVARELLMLRRELERFERTVCSVASGPYRATG